MKDKVEVFNDHIIKYNTSRFSKGLEWVTESLSINHNREVRVYRWYQEKKTRELLIPKVFEINQNFIKIEKVRDDSNEIQIPKLITSIREFVQLGMNEKMNLYDFLSSPTQSILRGLFTNVRFLGFRIIFQAIRHLLVFYSKKPKNSKTFLIHKDLKKDQNMISTKKGVYFIDFGSSILTKNYFLTDIVELSTDHINFKVNFDLINSFISDLGIEDYDLDFLKSQIFLLLLRRYLHFHPLDRSNPIKMNNAREFLGNLDSLVAKFKS